MRQKIIIVFLALSMLIALCACGANTPPIDVPSSSEQSVPVDSSDESGVVPAFDFDAILAGESGTVYANCDEATKQQLVAAGKEENIDVEFLADGSTQFTYEDGTVVTQSSDGHWTSKAPNGDTVEAGSDWPDNEYTKKLPKPDADPDATSVENGTFSAVFYNATVEQARSYTDKLVSKGFTVGATKTDENIGGIVVFSYNASNAEGNSVTVSFTAGVFSIMLM